MKLVDFKIKVNSEAESREVQELFFDLGYEWYTTGSEIIKTRYVGVFYIFAYRDDFKLTHAGHAETFKQKSDFKEITLQQLRDLAKQQQQFVEQQKGLQQQENLVKYEEWINTETFEVKLLPQGAAIKISEWVKIPEDAEFAVTKNGAIEFRKNTSYYHPDSDTWVKASWCFHDFPKGGWEVVWERKTTEVVKQQTSNKPDAEFIEQRAEVFKKLLQGVKFQYRYNDVGQWHNLTERSIGHLMKPNVAIREKPQKVTIDGIEMDKDAAIKYIEKHY